MPPQLSIFGLSIASALIFAGCAAQPVFVPLAPTHPASPWACETPLAPRSTTLAVNASEIVPPHPDWQIAGMRDNEIHGHAAGQPTAMDMMGHGHMMMDSAGNKQTMKGPGMIKMSAPADQVDYAPKGAENPKGQQPPEHQPEAHLDHVDPDRKAAGYVAAPIAPPMTDMKSMDHSTMGHADHNTSNEDEKPSEKDDKAENDKPAPDHAQHEH